MNIKKFNIWVTALLHNVLFTLLTCELSFIVKTEPQFIFSYISLVFLVISFIIAFIVVYYFLKEN